MAKMCLVSTDRLNHVHSQVIQSHEDESDPRPVGENLPHSYPATRFRREWAPQAPSSAFVVLSFYSSKDCLRVYTGVLLRDKNSE